MTEVAVLFSNHHIIIIVLKVLKKSSEEGKDPRAECVRAEKTAKRGPLNQAKVTLQIFVRRHFVRKTLWPSG